jgi:hypothetical protein
MDYDDYMQLRQEYLNGRKTDGNEGKLLKLKPEEYTAEQNEEIKRTRVALKHSMWAAKEARKGWLTLLNDPVANPATPITVARIVQKQRVERGQARHSVRDNEVAYRMAVEVPFLMKQKLRSQAKRPSFLPFEPGMEVKMFGRNPFTGLPIGGITEHRHQTDKKPVTSLRESLRRS